MVVYQGLPKIQVKDLGHQQHRTAHLKGLSPDSWVVPCYNRLGMGSTLSADIVAAVVRWALHMSICRSSLYLEPVEFLWLNCPSDQNIKCIAWELFAGCHSWTDVFQGLNTFATFDTTNMIVR